MSSVSTDRRRTLRDSQLSALPGLTFRTHADRPCLVQGDTQSREERLK